jgi:hypothetical protein
MLTRTLSLATLFSLALDGFGNGSGHQRRPSRQHARRPGRQQHGERGDRQWRGAERQVA